MSQHILLRGARQLLTLHGPDGPRRGSDLRDLGVVQDGSVLIKDGVIVSVGNTRRVENLKEARGALEIDVHTSVIMPGFVDAGLQVSPYRSGFTPESEKPQKIRHFYEHSLDLLRSCLHHGTLAAELKTFTAGFDFNADISVLRRLAKIGDNPVGMVRTWRLARCPRPGQEMNAFLEALAILARRKLVRFIEIESGEEQEISNELLEAARAMNIRLKVVWTGGSTDSMQRMLTRLAPAAVGCSSTMTSEDVACLSKSPSVGIFSPGRELQTESGPALRQMVDRAGLVALSSGYDARASPGFSMQMAVSLAAVKCNLSMEEAISAATVNAAHAIGCGGTMGTLERGKSANILVLNIPDYREIPRQFGINHVGMVMRDGAVVLNRGRWKIGAHEPTPGRVRAQHI